MLELPLNELVERHLVKIIQLSLRHCDHLCGNKIKYTWICQKHFCPDNRMFTK